MPRFTDYRDHYSHGIQEQLRSVSRRSMAAPGSRQSAKTGPFRRLAKLKKAPAVGFGGLPVAPDLTLKRCR